MIQIILFRINNFLKISLYFLKMLKNKRFCLCVLKK